MPLYYPPLLHYRLSTIGVEPDGSFDDAPDITHSGLYAPGITQVLPTQVCPPYTRHSYCEDSNGPRDVLEMHSGKSFSSIP
jgi:hypothetical protein